jgi:hypothetical protein
MEQLMTTQNIHQEKFEVWQELLQAHSPKVRFEDSLRNAGIGDKSMLDHFEFMMAVMELHPIIPFEECSFGSDLLDDRRALAYHIIQRQLGHSRSLVVNANIRNRAGVGISLRSMLEMYAFVRFFQEENRLEDDRLIEVFLQGQSFATGGWYELEKVWQEEHNEPFPKDAKKFVEATFGIPRLNKVLKPTHDTDEGFSYLYSRYSEFVHPSFARPRADFEEALGQKDPSPRGSTAYYREETQSGAPLSLILKDVHAGSFCLEMFWPIALEIDPHFDKTLRPQIVQVLIDHGFDK